MTTLLDYSKSVMGLFIVHFLLITISEVTYFLVFRKKILSKLTTCNCKMLGLWPTGLINLCISFFVSIHIVKSYDSNLSITDGLLDMLPYIFLVTVIVDFRVNTYYRQSNTIIILFNAFIRFLLCNIANLGLLFSFKYNNNLRIKNK